MRAVIDAHDLDDIERKAVLPPGEGLHHCCTIGTTAHREDHALGLHHGTTCLKRTPKRLKRAALSGVLPQLGLNACHHRLLHHR